ncbi:MAG TPA: glycosyltransferase family 1 protein [Polyangiaceae bacterium]|nr:glycosyltransferase family 1 protein [Polyangiaceae bacterium]
MIDVLIDMTALNTTSRERGIGRYVRGLCGALSERERWLGQYPELRGKNLELAGLIRHRGQAAGALDPTLRFAGDLELKVSGFRYQRHKLQRRLYMGGLLSRLHPRLAHLPDPPGTPFDRRQRRIVTCHDLIPLVLADEYLSPLPGARLLQRERDKARYKTAARIIAISEATRRDLIEQLDISPERIDVVHHGVDHERFGARGAADEPEMLRADLGVVGPYLLYLGAGDARKNLPLLIRAYGQSGVSRDVSLVLAGPLGKRRQQQLSQIAAESGVTDRLHLLGYTDEKYIAPLYRHCLAHVFPSSYEGFGLTVLEAMACGAPTLTTAFSSLGEVAGDAALTLKELREEPFALELRRLVSDAELRAELRRRGLQHVQGFTWERCAAQTLACYQRALAEAAS